MLLCPHLFFKRVNAIYNFSGLGQLRRLSKGKRDFIFSLFKLVPSKGRRIIIVQNTDDLEYLKKKLTNKDRFRLELIPGSGFSRRLVDKKEENWGHRDGGIVIGYVGRINKDKGVLNLIRAVNELRGKGCNLNLKVWGRIDEKGRHGFSETELRYLQSNGDFLLGYETNPDVIYNSFDWFCLPSNGEGLSKAAIEAASYSKPLILSNVEGNRDMISENGYLFNYDDLIDLKRTILMAYRLEYSDYVKFSKRSLNLFEERWTLNAISKQWINIINDF